MDTQQLEKLKKLKDKGVITEEEYAEGKKQLLKSISDENTPTASTKKNADNPIASFILGVIIFVGLFMYFNNSFSNSSKTSSQAAIQQQATIPVQNITFERVSLYDLMREAQTNAARAQQKYKGKYVEFSGKIRNIDSDGHYFSIDTDEYTNDFLMGIRCDLNDSKNKQIIINKNNGSPVKVKGLIKRVGDISGYSVDVIEVQ